MLPIKYKDLDYPSASNASLFTLVDKETQTDPKSVPKQIINAIIAKPSDLELTVSYGQVREYESGILNAGISKEEIEQHKNEVLSTKSSHGKFLLGNIYQRESCTTPKSNKVPIWKLDDSFENEYPNSGYVYIPYFKTENVSKKGSAIISDHHICLTSENFEENTLSDKQSTLITKQETCIDDNVIEDNYHKELTDISSVKNVQDPSYPETGNEIIKENTEVILNTDNENKELIDYNSVKYVIETANTIIQENCDVDLNKDNNNKELTGENSAKNVIEIDNRIIKEIFDVNVHRDNDNNQLTDNNSAKINNGNNCTEAVNSNIKGNSDGNLLISNGEKAFSDVSFVENFQEKNYPKKNNSNLNKNIDLNSKSNLLQTDFDRKTNHDKKITSVSFITNPVERTGPDTRNSKENISDKRNNSSPSLTLGTKDDRLSNLTQGLKNCLSITMSIVMNPNLYKSNELKLEAEKDNKEELCKEVKEEKTKDTNEIKKSSTSLYRNLEQAQKSTNECPIDIKPEKKPSDTPSKASGPRTNLKRESTQTIESEHLSPLADEMRPNNEFVSEDFVFNDNGQQPPIDIEVTADEYSEEGTSLTSTQNVHDSNKLMVKSSRTSDEHSKNIDSKVTEHALNSNDENIYKNQSPPMNNSESIGPMIIAKLMGGAGSVVASLNKHINLDRISYFQNKEESDTGSEQKNRIRPSTDLALSHSYVPSPTGYFATFKSTIFGFFCDKRNPSQPSETITSSSSGTSSEMSEDETDT